MFSEYLKAQKEFHQSLLELKKAFQDWEDHQEKKQSFLQESIDFANRLENAFDKIGGQK